MNKEELLKEAISLLMAVWSDYGFDELELDVQNQISKFIEKIPREAEL